MIDAGFQKTIVDTQGKKVNTWSLQCIKQMLRYYNFKVSAGNPFFSLHFVRENIYNKFRKSLIMTRPPLPWFLCLSDELTMRNIFERTARGRSRGLWCEVSWEAQDVESGQFTLRITIDPNTTTAVENVSKPISLRKQSPADFSTGWRAFSRLAWQCHRFEQSFVYTLYITLVAPQINSYAFYHALNHSEAPETFCRKIFLSSPSFWQQQRASHQFLSDRVQIHDWEVGTFEITVEAKSGR